LKDSRNDQLYQVAKLADGKCWMLNNLRFYGSNTSSSYFEEFPAPTTEPPEYYYSKPIPPLFWYLNKNDSLDVGSDEQPSLNYAEDNFYGYAYNWYTATAGHGQPAGINDTGATGLPESSVCPSGWRLPTINVNGSGNLDGSGDFPTF
jgi:hypothetical protein